MKQDVEQHKQLISKSENARYNLQQTLVQTSVSIREDASSNKGF